MAHRTGPPFTEWEDQQIIAAADLKQLALRLGRTHRSVEHRASYLRLRADPKRYQARLAGINARRHHDRGPSPADRIRGDGKGFHKIEPPPPRPEIAPPIARPDWFEENINPMAGR